MSIPVDLGDLARAVAGRPFGYLLTVGEDERPKVVALVPAVHAGELWFAAGGTSARNVDARPAVSVVFPPTPRDPYTLLVDGTARRVPSDPDDPEGETRIVVGPTWAVRHRPAPSAPDPPGGADPE